MATFTAIKNKKQTAGVLGGVLKYVQQEKKTRAGVLRSYCYYKMYEAQEGGFEMSDYVFTNERGELMHPDTFSRHLRQLYDENGFPR